MEKRKPNASRSTNGESSTRFRLLGLLPLIFFMAQAIYYWRRAELGHMLWMCNVGNLLLAIGLILNHSALTRVAVLWMIPGFIIWILFVVMPWGMYFSSTLAHIGGLAVSLIAVRRVGVDRMAWLYAFAWYLGIQWISYLVTQPAMNVNLAHQIQPGWERAFTAYWQFFMVLTVAVAAMLWIVGQIVKKFYPAGQVSLKSQVP